MHRSNTLNTHREHNHTNDGDTDHVTKWLGALNGAKVKQGSMNSGDSNQLKGCNSINAYIIKGFKKCHSSERYECKC